MSRILRYYREGDICFITNVTYNRVPILIENADLFRQSLKNVQNRLSFELIAWVIMPDHFHILIDSKIISPSDIMKKFKLSFGYFYRKRKRIKSGRIWQARYWDHIIRNQEDLNNHIDYIHYNPVKHGLIGNPFHYEYSSASKYLEDDYYSNDWGVKESFELEGEFGE